MTDLHAGARAVPAARATTPPAPGEWSANEVMAHVVEAGRHFRGYLAKLQIAARQDPELTHAVLRVGQLSAAPPTLLHPRIALRLLLGHCRPRPARTPPARMTVAPGRST